MSKKKTEPITNQIEEPTSQLPKVIKRIKFKTKNQKRFYNAIEDERNNIILAHALAGAGKTFIAIQKGLELLLHRPNNIKKLIIVNPTVDVGNEDKLGFLPGDLMEKISWHAESSIFILHKIIGEIETKKLIEKGKLEFRVLNFMRGINFEDAIIILDEAQNASPLQIKPLVTRIADTCKLILMSDLSQTDKYRSNGQPAYEKSGLYDAWTRFGGIDGVYQIEFTKDDCIRSGIVKRLLERYELEEQIMLGEHNPYSLDIDLMNLNMG